MRSNRPRSLERLKHRRKALEAADVRAYREKREMLRKWLAARPALSTTAADVATRKYWRCVYGSILENK